MPIITLPDGSKKVFEKSVTILEIAQSIGAGLANPAPILWAISRIVTDFSKTFFEPSGKVIIGMIYFSISKNPNFDLTLFKV